MKSVLANMHKIMLFPNVFSFFYMETYNMVFTRPEFLRSEMDKLCSAIGKGHSFHAGWFVLAFIAWLTMAALFIWDFELEKDLSSTFWSSERQLKMYFRLVPHFFPECIKAGSR
jgi:hypothetical protein